MIQSINITQAIASHTACDASTVSQLRLQLFPEKPVKSQQEKKASRTVPCQKSQTTKANKYGRGRTRKPLDVIVHESSDETSPVGNGGAKLATEVVNVVLKVFTEAVKSRPLQQEPGVKKRSSDIRTSNAADCSPKGQHRTPNPLQPLCANIIATEKTQAKDSRQTVHPNGIRAADTFQAQAECARLAFSALTIYRGRGGQEQKPSTFQLEKSMSFLVNKFLTLELFEPAEGQLRLLKTALIVAAGVEKVDVTLHGRVGTQDRLTDLLAFPHTVIEGHLLGIVVSFQLQVFRLIAAKADATQLRATIEYLQLTNPCSPIKTIQAQLDSQDPATHSMVANQLETLSRLILSMCPITSSLRDQDLDVSKSMDAFTALRFQLLALKLRPLWWGAAGHKGDFGKDLLDPFSRYLSTFRRRCTTELSHGYSSAKDFYSFLVSIGQDERYSASMSITWNDAWHTIYTELIELSRHCCFDDETQSWLDKYTGIGASDNASSCQRCIIACNRAVMLAQNWVNHTREDKVVDAFRAAEQRIQDDLDGGSEDLDELLLVVTRLRKSAAFLINKSQKPLKSHEKAPSPEVIRQCYNICSSCVRFLNRYIGSRPPQGTHHISSQRYKQRLEKALPAVQVFVDSVALIARLAKGDNPKEWARTADGLQACLNLATRTQDACLEGYGEHEGSNAVSNINVAVSNAYWIRYLHLKQSNGTPKDIAAALEGSINAVKGQPTSYKCAAQLQTRLEHYGIALEVAREYHKAAEAYGNAIRAHMDMSSLQKAAAAAATQPISILFTRQPELASLGRVFKAYLRVAIKKEAGAAPYDAVFDDKTLEPSQRGVALEYQLHSLASETLATAITPQMDKTVSYLGIELLEIYSEQLFPIRRLRVVESLMWLRVTRPEFVAPELAEQLSASTITTTTHKLHSNDSWLESSITHLQVSVDAILAIQEDCPLRKQQNLKNALTCWFQLVNQSPNLETLETSTGDVPAWLLHLEILAQYLDVYGLHLQRRSLLEIIAIAREKYFPTQHMQLLLSWTRIGLQHSRLGYPSQAGLAFLKAARRASNSEVTTKAKIWFYAAYAEYFLLAGNADKCEENLSLAHEIFESRDKKGENLSRHDRIESAKLMAEVTLLYADLAERREQYPRAVAAAKRSLRLAHQAWRSTEKSWEKPKTNGSVIEELVDPISKMAVTDNDPAKVEQQKSSTAAVFWPLVPQLHKAYLHMAQLYRNGGILNEAKYYLEKSQKLAESASASGLLAVSLSQYADLLTRSGQYDEAGRVFETASGHFRLLEEDQHRIQFELSLSNYQGTMGQLPAAERACTVAESILRHLLDGKLNPRHDSEQLDVVALQDQLSGMSIGEKATHPDGSKKRGPLKKSAREAPPVAKATESSIPKSSSPQTPYSALVGSGHELLRQRLQLAIKASRFEQASMLLSGAAKTASIPQDTVLHLIAEAEISIGRSLDAIKNDPVYCVLAESTAAIPSVLPEKSSGLVDPPKQVPARTGRKPANPGPVVTGSKKARSTPKACLQSPGNEFRRAQISASKAYQMAISLCSTASLHRSSKMMAETLLTSSALDLATSEEALKPTSSTFLGVTDIARSVSMIRGQQVVQVEKIPLVADDLHDWPNESREEMEDLHLSNKHLDFPAFQEQYLDIIPRTWQVLNMSLSRSQREVILCRIRPNQSPFVISLPLDRHSSRDPHEENFGYIQAKTELHDIISLTNYSTHDTPDMSRKGAKSAWWEGRAVLDARLKDLLTNIENMWFGGFQGVFSQIIPDRELLSRFQESLNVILDNHLPSRQGSGKKQKPQRIKLDPRVIELFVALGDPALFSDMEEPLMDLLYFVIDILQFHGERNAYDEIDFDSMTVEIFDTLRQYHEALRRIADQPAMEHTILILDKELHCFPWESLPCLDGQAVTRLPSLRSLRDRILRQQHEDGAASGTSDEPKFCVDRRTGAYILNPAGDLEATQAKFEQSLSMLGEWQGYTRLQPEEERFKQYLEEHDIFLYFGHGSGNQYIRSKTIQKLDRCAVALLMGCSSGKLVEAGEFEPYGTPMSYMQAGCPAMVATLWNVTDKDIDRFSETMLQDWGLFSNPAPSDSSPVKKRTRAKGKGKARLSQSRSSSRNSGKVSLDQAVAQGRKSCIFRYLNGAAPVVYGIPMFLS
ncbi:MAG: hypothetical protein Q9219_002747 [cf. Caloplaca sp. 3 TL-2023]